jgi:type IV secretory pathway TrbL component
MNVPISRSTWIAVIVASATIIAVIAIVVWLWGQLGDVEISVGGWIAMGLGVLFALALGIGLMSLLFISSRRGYDDLDRDRR